MEVFGNADLFGAFGEAEFGFHFRGVVGAAVEPFDVVVYGVANGDAGRQRFEIFGGEVVGSLNASIDVVTLIEVDVLEEVAADGSGGDGVAEHFDSGEVRNRSIDWHQSLPKVFIDRRDFGLLWHGRVCEMPLEVHRQSSASAGGRSYRGMEREAREWRGERGCGVD